jgi:factor associated with neutral sphingomyelinase activation
LQIATIIYSRQQRVTFDPLWLEDLNERVVVEFAASKIQPLVNNPGRVLLTNQRLYFQPFNNVETVRKCETFAAITQTKGQ